MVGWKRFATVATGLPILSPRDGLPQEQMSLSQIRNVAVLGSTGSIGRAALDVISHHPTRLFLTAIACHSQLDLLEQQIVEHAVPYAFATNAHDHRVSAWGKSTRSNASPSSNAHIRTTQRSTDSDLLLQLIQGPEIDTVVAAIVGIAGLETSLAAAQNGKRLALANKESLVVAGSLMMQAAKTSGAEILPVDSEHSAIFQALQSASEPKQVKRIILTASGGPLRNWPVGKLPEASVEDALSHPTWRMGRKITVDSATMMNKALEAKWLFDLRPEQISVVIHPQSIIHSMVEFVDGSVIAQLSPPDMRLPIQYALTYPERITSTSPCIDWASPMQLDWKPADLERYPALALGFEVIERSGTCGAVLNAANEAAVQLFLDKKIKLTDIATICRDVLHNHHYSPSPTLSELLGLDAWGRNEVQRWIQIPC
jgi:1-deoxy-D-xylulose-5-phosphate reductoisomerase